ncbi:MAG: DUF4209 domain-containing protein [Candidatus Gastranaerophilales bacterium]
MKENIKFIKLDDLYAFIDENKSELINADDFFKYFCTIEEKNISKGDLIKIDIEKNILMIISEAMREKIKKEVYQNVTQNTEYIVSRFKKTSNILLKAYYSEILFNCGIGEYIKPVIENYLKVFDYYIEIKICEIEKYNWIHIDRVINCLIEYSLISKSKKIKEIKDKIFGLLSNYKEDEPIHTVCQQIAMHSTDFLKFYKKDEFKIIKDLIWKIGNQYLKQKEYAIAERYFKKGLQLEKIINEFKYNWNIKIGQCYEKLVECNDGSVAIHWCVNAINHYKEMDCTSKKIELLEKMYLKAKNNIQFGTIETPVNIKEFIKVADEILEKQNNQILPILAHSEHLLPHKSVLIKSYSSLDDIIPCSYLDSNLHTSKILDIKTELDRALSNYSSLWSIQQIVVQKVLYEGIVQDKITIQTLLNYLLKSSWFFEMQTQNKGNKKKIKYNWSQLFLSIFKKYFSEIKRYHENPKIFYPDVIAITDSLVLKFETLLRIYLQCWEQSTFKPLKKEQGIVREKDIMDLLYDDFLIEQLSFDDLLYFRYLFIAKEGLNLRNTVAHALLIPENYTYELFNLVFFAYLRLSKYLIPQQIKKIIFNYNE